MHWKYLSPVAIFICVLLAMELTKDTNIFIRLGLCVSIIAVYIASFNNGIRIGEKTYCSRCKDLTKDKVTFCSKCLCDTIAEAGEIMGKMRDQG
jgi:hypothetical protein